MLIINADDLGRSRMETDAALSCLREGRITSVSAMVFMEDSERAANLARDCGVDAGLHLNLSQVFSGRVVSPAVAEAHNRIVGFMKTTKYALLVYHPFLRRCFRDVYQTQADEFVRLFGKSPSHVDGHQHRHLCANMLLDEIIPRGQKVRRNPSLSPGEKGPLNRAYRRLVDRWLGRRYCLTDYLFNLAECMEESRLARVLGLAKVTRVELETHPCRKAEHALLMSDAFGDRLREIRTASYAVL